MVYWFCKNRLNSWGPNRLLIALKRLKILHFGPGVQASSVLCPGAGQPNRDRALVLHGSKVTTRLQTLDKHLRLLEGLAIKHSVGRRGTCIKEKSSYLRNWEKDIESKANRYKNSKNAFK